MTVKIDTDANITRIRFAQQTSHPSAPASGFNYLYIVSGSAHGGLYLEDSAGRKIGPFITGSAGGGAPTDAEYVTTASSGNLSAEVVIPGLAGSSDIAGSGGAGVSHEFDSGASPLTWSAAVDTENVNSTIPSHLYIQDDGASQSFGSYSWSPAGAFDIRMKLSMGAEIGSAENTPAVGLVVGNSDLTDRAFVELEYPGASDRLIVTAYTCASSSVTQRGTSQLYVTNSIYLRIKRDGSNNVSFYYSNDGLTWLLIITQAFTFTAAKAGVRMAADSVTTTAAIDWIRSDV